MEKEQIGEKTMHLKYEFTVDEKRRIVEDLTDAIQEKENLDGKLASVQSQIKSEIKIAEAKIKILTGHYKDGYEYRDFRCDVILDYDNKMRQYKSLEDGAILKEEKFTPEDYQRKLPLGTTDD